MPLIKQFTVKIYDQLGTTLKKTLAPNMVKNTLSFSNRINAGVGQLMLDLQLPFNDFDEGDSIDYSNVVRVHVSEENNPNGRLVYTGYIYKYDPYLVASNEGVKVYCLGLISLLKDDYYKDGSSYTVTKSGVDPGQLTKDVIDHYNSTVSHNLISYTGSSIETVGTVIDYEFVDRKHFDALQDTAKNADGGWWSLLDKNGVMNLKQKPTSATHTFTIGKDIEKTDVPKEITDMANAVHLRYDGGTVDVEDATSIARYGRKQIIIENDQAKDAAAATQEANKVLADRKDAKIQSPLIINSNYDIETIQPGDTCKVLNVTGEGQLFSDNMQIFQVTYNLHKVVLKLDGFSGSFIRELDKFVNT